jgi:citrate lyase beta subunit
MIEYTQLGATLFVPATHKNLQSILKQEKYPNLKSIVVDLEDGIGKDDLILAKELIKNILKNYSKNSLLVFIRPRDPNTLKELLAYEGIEKVDGFVLPKFSQVSADEYLKLLKHTNHHFMPSIEGGELFDKDELKKLKDKIVEYRDRVILVRIGLEDMLKQLGMRRSSEYSIFDYAVCSSVIGDFLALFKSSGFAVSGGVYPYFKDKEGFVKDVRRDLKEGLFSKTIIHPSQIDIVHEHYKVTKQEYEESKAILESSSAVINLDGKMGEVKTMSPHSREIIRRAQVYGFIS